MASAVRVQVVVRVSEGKVANVVRVKVVSAGKVVSADKANVAAAVAVRAGPVAVVSRFTLRRRCYWVELTLVAEPAL